MRTTLTAAALVASIVAPSAAFAQRFPFERTLEAAGTDTLDVSTVRGKIDVLAGQPGQIVIEGAATVRVGITVPANAVELAKRVAASPPIEQTGSVIRLTIPSDQEARRAVTINYRVHVPPGTTVRANSESGETSIHGTTAAVNVRTQSGAITVGQLSGPVEIGTGSGAVAAEDIAGPLSVKTASSAFNGTGLGPSLTVRTESGSVQGAFAGRGDADVQTGSSAVTLRGVRGGLTVKTQSGQVTLAGTPLRDWTATTGSSSVKLELESGSGFRLDAASRSGKVTVNGVTPAIATTTHSAVGTIGQGDATVRIRTGSGAIRVEVAGLKD